MWKCDNCRRTFEEPEECETTYEDMYGVAGQFGSSTPCTVYVCPYCGDDGYLEELEDEEEIEDED